VLSTRSSIKLFLVALLSAHAFAETITGTVTNKTTNKPAAGDDVVLIRLAQGMQESTRAKTDSRGRFSLDVPDPGGIHLVRVTHDKANYFQPVQPTETSVQVDVYTAAAKVEGVTGEADVLKIQSDPGGANLSVIEMFFVKNVSSPAKTQFSDRPFDFFLPEGAVVEGSVALGPGGMPVRSAPVPLGDPNHYAFIFPIRPGETRFQVTYKVPYKGTFTFAPHPILPTDTVAIVLPKSMTFAPAANSPYARVTEETTAQAYAARGVTPTQPLGFTVSGTGELPRDENTPPQGAAQGANAGAPQPDQSTGSAATDTRPGGGLGNPVDPTGDNDPWAKYKWWIIGGLGLLLAAGAGIMLKQPVPVPAGTVPPQPNPANPPAPGGSSTLNALRDELFALETERLQGTLSEPDYQAQKAALETVLRRALTRATP
jgi:hypothetical protein